MRSQVTRRTVLNTGAKLAVLVAALAAGESPVAADDQPAMDASADYSADFVSNLAKGLAAKPYVDEKITFPSGFDALSYAQYRGIHFDPAKAIWKGEPHGFAFETFHTGFYFTRPVDVYVVDGDKQARLKYDPDLFTFATGTPKPNGKDDLHYSGIRLRYPLNNKDMSEEFAVFQGASYFRAVGKGLIYGLSARGLAIDTGQPAGEEFPFFRAFWIKRPEGPNGIVVVEALLNSPSVAGAYRFSIKPGADTQMDVEMTLFPRRDIAHAGIAPLTSMFLFDAMGRLVDDYRAAVHDSHGLAMLKGSGEWLWRPLSNRKTLQVSAFVDMSPRGFGLMQRKRRYEEFLDPRAQYEKRPSLWVEPIGDWAAGDVELFEIPSLHETNDNIVAFWHPKDPLRQGQTHSFVYRLHWCNDWPLEQPGPVSKVRYSATGTDDLSAGGPLKYDPNLRIYVVEFASGILASDIKPDVSANAGRITGIALAPNSLSNTLRLTFHHDATGIDAAELRAILKSGDKNVSETWLYRWTRP